MPTDRSSPTMPSVSHTAENGAASALDIGLIADLRRQIFDLHTVFDIARRFHAVPDTDALLEGILLASVGQLGVGRAAVVVAGPGEDGTLSRCRAVGWDDVPVGDWHVRVDSPLAQELLRRQGPAMYRTLDNSAAGGSSDVERLHRNGCEVVAPILARGELAGVLFLSGKLNRTAFTVDDEKFLGLLLEQFAVALDNARLYESEREMGAELLSTQERLARTEKLLALGRLSAAIAHEVRNPLGIIRNHLELIRPAIAVGSVDAERLDVIAAEVYRIERVVAGLLGAFHPVRDVAPRVDLSEIIADVGRSIAPQMQEHGIVITSDMPPSLPPAAGESESLRQVVLNLFLNARDAMSAGGTLSIMARCEGDWVIVEFTDEGPGIDPVIQQTLFAPFTTTKKPGEGTGLGLSICQSVVDGFGGSIEAANIPAPGHGAIFTLRLPRAAVGQCRPDALSPAESRS
ncbi:MAG: ATP-binding protein [Candidatus Zixiibacteriota bacterium]